MTPLKLFTRLLKGFVLAILISLAAWSLLSGKRPEIQLPPGTIEVEYWEKWTGHEMDQMKQIVADFNQTVGAEKHIYVNCMSMTAVEQKTLVAIAGGVPPDVAGVWDGQVVQYAEADAIEPLEDMAREHGITADYYKKVYWDACSYNGHLWGLISTPAALGMLYNKRIFEERAADLRAAGLDPTRAPETIEELDRYAKALDQWTTDSSGRKKLNIAGLIPMEPDWYTQFYWMWFGGQIWDGEHRKINLLGPKVIAAYAWMETYAKRLGQDAMGDFRSGFGQFNSAQNAFLAGQVAMEMQGPWMANYIGNLKPSLNQWKMSKEEERKLPFMKRRDNYEWGAAAFPSGVPGVKDISYISFDCLVIPRGAKHKKEAFEFIAFVNSQTEMEKLCSLHCKNSPLARVSADFLNNHPNPYIDVYERLASSPNAQYAPQCPIFPEVQAELRLVALNVSTLQSTPVEALTTAQHRIDKIWSTYEERRHLREQEEH